MAAARVAAAAANKQKAALLRPGQRPGLLLSEAAQAALRRKVRGALRIVDGSMKSARQHRGLDVAAQYSCGKLNRFFPAFHSFA
jgi:hypothetical protein